MPSLSIRPAPARVSLPLDIQTIIVRDHLIAEYRLHCARTYRVPATGYDIRKKTPDRPTLGPYALVSSYWRALVQSVLFQKFHLEGLHKLRDLEALCKQNPTLATYTRELRVVSGDWEAPPKNVPTCMVPSNVSHRRAAPDPTVLEQFSQAMWTMLQHWNSVRAKSYGRMPLSLQIEFYVLNPATGLPKCFAPLMTVGYADPKLEFLDSLEIKAHNVSKPALRRILPPVFYPAPLLPIVLAARELQTLALRTEVLSEDSTAGTPDSDSDDGAIVPRTIPGVTSMTSSNLTQLLPRVAYRSLKSVQFELFMTRPLRTGAPDLLSRAVRNMSYSLTEFRAYISHISTEIFAPDTYDDDDLQGRWQEMKTYSLAFGDQDAWGDAYFFSAGPHQNIRSPRLERLEPFLRASVEQLTHMPKIEKWEVGCSMFHFQQPSPVSASVQANVEPRIVDLCMTVIVTRDRYSETAVCHHTKSYLPSNRVKEILRQRWPQIRFETSLGPRMMDWRSL